MLINVDPLNKHDIDNFICLENKLWATLLKPVLKAEDSLFNCLKIGFVLCC